MGVCTPVRDWTPVNKAEADQVLLALAGDREAEQELLGKYRRIFGGLFNRTYPRCLSHRDDCVQEALIKVSKNLSSYHPERGPFGKWAKVVARNAFYTYLKKHVFKWKYISLDALPEDALSTWAGPEAECFSYIVAEEVQKLEPDQSAAVGGRYYHELTDREIASLRRIARRKVGCYRDQGKRNLKKRFLDSPLISIRQKGQIPQYYIIETDSIDPKRPALPGREDGDSA
jgi:RNA polymerase sigma factor (sigma-70 family)